MRDCWSMVADGRIQSTNFMWHICTAWRMRYFRLIVNRRKNGKMESSKIGWEWVQQTKDSFDSQKEVASVWDCDHVARICVSGVRLKMVADDPRWPRQQQWSTVKRQPPFWSLTPTRPSWPYKYTTAKTIGQMANAILSLLSSTFYFLP